MKSLFAFIFLVAALSVSAQQGIFLNETFYSGFLNVETKGQIFYWLFESRNNPATDPLIIWLGGGQGCSSEISVLYETGPYRMFDYQNESITLQINPYSWNNVANVLYVDHPLGIGYSQANTYEQNEAAVAQDAGLWLAEFLGTFPQYKGRNFYLAGNSYGAHYIPAVYSNISTSVDLVAKGILIGNGWIDPTSHLVSDAKYAFQHELINQAKYDTLSAEFAACVTLINQKQFNAAITACQASLKQLIGNPPNFNYYNINQTCNGTDCIDYYEAIDFLGLLAPELILGVGQAPWSPCNATVNGYFNQDRIQSVSGALGALLNSGTPVLIYNGDLDLMVNWIGGEYAATNITWNGQQQFNSASYNVNGDFGEYKVYENLIFYKVYNAGHLVGMDQPQASLDLLLKFIGGWPSSGYAKLDEDIIM